MSQSSSLINSLPPRAIVSIPALEEAKRQCLDRLQELKIERTRQNIDLTRARCASLSGFIKEAWEVLEPSTPYVHGRHIDVCCDHLEAVARGDIKRLIINIPPAFMKTLLVAVFFPMWLWGPVRRSGERFLCLSHEESLAIEASTKCRRLLQSEWYQTLWGDDVRIVADQNRKDYFENTATGFRQVATFDNVTGRRGDIVIVDDPISVKKANSETERNTVNRWFQEALPSRVNDPTSSRMILMMQRVHENDPTGFILAQDWGWEHLMLPMRYEAGRAAHTSLGKVDWRKEEGQPLFPERFPIQEVERLETELGEYATAGQLQQRPAPREGGMFKVDKIDIVDHCPSGSETVSAWDLAGSKRKTSPYTARVLMTRVGGDIYVRDVKRWRADPTEVERLIEQTCIDDRNDVPSVLFSLPQDPGYGGKAAKWRHAEILIGFNYKITPEGRDDKQTRAEPFAAQVGAERVHLVRGSWNAAYIEELRNFPSGTYKDQVDASSRAFQELVKPRSRRSIGAPIFE